MSKLLFVAYYFYPAGGVASIRAAKFVKHLSKNGWDVTVLTKEADSSLGDDSLQEDVGGVNIIRVKDSWSKLLKGIPARLHISPKRFKIPDPQQPWAKRAYKQVLDDLKKGEYDVIVTTASPFSSHLLGLRLKKETNIPWLADFRDPWSKNYGIIFPTAKHHRKEEEMENEAIKNADAISTVTRSLEKEWQDCLTGEDKSKVVFLPNGYDSIDFPGTPYVKKENFTLLFTGSLWSLDPIPVFTALEQMKQSNALDKRIRVKFVGQSPKKWEDAASNMRLSDIVKFSGLVPHNKIPIMLETADCLLQILYRGKGRERILGGKAGEYLASKRPILTIADKGELERTMRDANAGPVVEPENIDGIVGAISSLFKQWESGVSIGPRNEDVLSEFNYQNISVKLNQVICNIVEDEDGGN